MDIKYAKEYGETLLDYAFDMLWLRSTSGCNHAEFIFVRLSEHLEEHPELKSWYLENLKLTISKDWPYLSKETKRPAGFVPGELVDYIAHVKRWPELRSVAEEELVKRQGDEAYFMNRNYCSSMLEALEDEWVDKDFYRSL